MKPIALLTTLILIASVGTYGILAWTSRVNENQNKVEKTTKVATTTPEEVEEIKEEVVTPKKEEPKPIVVPTPTPTYVAPTPPAPKPEPTYTPPPVIINNTNIQTAPQQQAPPPTNAPQFVEPVPKTDLEIATEIVHLYDPNGSAEYYNENMIRVRAFGNKTVTIERTQGWEERLKLTLNKIK